MEQSEIVGALIGLKALDGSDLPRYKRAVEAGQQLGWGYYFPYLLTRTRAGRSAVLATDDEGSMCLFLWRLQDGRQRLDLPVAPTPMQPSVLRRCLERANDFNDDRSARILRIDEKDFDAVSELPRVRVRPRKSQYIFAPSTYEDLGGSRLKTIRRNVALVDGLPDVEVRPYTPSDADACRSLMRRWRRQQSGPDASRGGLGVTRGALELAGKLPEADLRGEVISVNGQLSAFAFGGEIRPGLGCFMERRCDHEVRGLSYYHLRSFLLTLGDHELVNDGSDAGRPGLRQLKDSFRAVRMHTEFRGSQRG